MKRNYLYICLIGIFILSSANSFQPDQNLPKSLVEPGDSTDILPEVEAMQKNMPDPPTKFRSGHVDPREINDYLKDTKEGFEIQLPRKSLTPSPTIYKGLMYVSGGFGSKEFYAFDAVSGKVKWAINLDDDGPSSAVVEEDIVVFNTESCTIFACNAFSGEMLWSFYLGDPLMSTPSIADGIVFTAYPAGRGNYSLPQNNNQIYQQNIPNQINPVSPPTGKKGNKNEDGVSKLRGTHVLIALDLKSGEILWQKWIDGDIMSAPIIEEDELYVTTFPGTLYKFESKTGNILAANASRATSAPIVVGNQVYMSRRADGAGDEVSENIGVMNRGFASFKKNYYTKAAPYLDQKVQNTTALKSAAAAYDAGNGFAAGAPANSGWEAASDNIGQSNVSSLQAFQGSRILHHKGKNYATMGDELVCTDPESGDMLWTQKLKGDINKSGGYLATPPINVGEKIIIATLDGEIIIANANTGKELKRYNIGEQIRFQPVADNGNLYISTVNGKVFCIKTGDEDITGWPTWGANAAHTNKIQQQ